MKFRITLHSGATTAAQPPDAIDRLWQHLHQSHERVSFARTGGEITASWGEDVPSSMERDERDEIGRRMVLDVVREVCERTPELELDWFAVGFFR